MIHVTVFLVRFGVWTKWALVSADFVCLGVRVGIALAQLFVHTCHTVSQRQ